MATRTAQDYLRMLQSLLPPGKAWTRDDDSMVSQVLYGLAEEFARVEVRINNLLAERDSRTTTELLSDYETEYDLPDSCTEATAVLQDRRLQLHNKIIAVGGQHKQYFIDLMTDYGFTTKIIEYVYNRFHWTVVYKSTGIIYFIVGLGKVGDPLSTATTASTLECIINKLKPAHTVATFTTTDYAFDSSFGPAFDSVYERDTTYLEGAFDRSFGISYDVRWGGAFDYRQFGRGFEKPVILGYDSYYGFSFDSAFDAAFIKGTVVGF